MAARTLIWLAALLFFVCAGAAAAAEDDAPPLQIYMFSQEGCPYCAAARADIGTLAKQYPTMRIRELEVGVSEALNKLYFDAIQHFRHDQTVVPLVVIGNRSFIGHLSGGRSRALYEDAIKACLSAPCEDVIAALAVNKPEDSGFEAKPPSDAGVPDKVDVPFYGTVHLQSLSLPVLTVLLAAVDGFNPCAMWVLVFLIGLLMGLQDPVRMWILGGAFLFATAVMYFAVMAAWLNLFLFLDAIVWVRIAVGILAVGGGLYFLREYWTKPEAVCHVANPKQRTKVMNAFRQVVEADRFLLSVAGIMLLAVLVNFIELICSAGIPAVYTQILALNDIPPSAHYGYIMLYIAVFMLDDVAIFVTAMVALRVSGLTGTYARYSHLIGGIVLLVLGAIMLLRPELLSFA